MDTAHLSLSLLAIIVIGFGECSRPVIVEHPRSGVYARGDAIKLHCRTGAESPLAEVQWIKDGRVLQPDPSLRIQDSDYLMILSAHQGRRSSHNDFGTYQCNVSNTDGWTLSRKANISMAFLRSQFLLSPQSVKVARGDAAVFECRPPRGSPEPLISWWKDGVELPRSGSTAKLGKAESAILGPIDGRVRYLSNGNLEIVDIKRTDAGHYVCRAENVADNRQTVPAMLEVTEKPKITMAPQNKTVSEGQLIEFKCRAEGSPTPMIFWSRRNSASARPLPSRAQIVNADTLVINPVSEEDAGTYVCQARNEAGSDTREARLRVNSKPTFRIQPSPRTVAAQGRTVVMECSARGYPLPAVYWQLPDHFNGIQLLLGQSHDGGRIFVADDGSLHIRDLGLADSGRFTCLAISNLGRAEAFTQLEVRLHDPRPAPKIIDKPPTDQLVLPRSRVSLHCQAEGSPQPSIRWNRDGRPIVSMRSAQIMDRISISQDGTTLDITDVQPQDAGVYQCRAISETGETTVNSRIRIDSVPGLAWEVDSGFDPRGAPGAPSRPAVLDASDKKVSLTWTRSPYEGRSPVFGYIIEKLDLDGGVALWQVVDLSIPNDRYIVSGLRPSSAYQFRIRARNSYGYSLPSEASDPVRTLAPGSNAGLLSPSSKFVFTGRIPKSPVFRLLESEVVSASSVRLNWRRLSHYDLIHHIKVVAESQGDRVTHEIDKRQLGHRWFLLTGLNPFSNYRVEMTPYFDDTQFGLSQSSSFQTFEAAPDAKVEKLKATRVDNGTRVLVEWQPPVEDGQNGVIIGYRVQLFLGPNAPSLFPLLTRVTNKTSRRTHFYNIRPEEEYVVKITAMNRAGEGPIAEARVEPWNWSQPSLFRLITSHPAFLPTLLGSVLGLIAVLLAVYTACVCRRRTKRFSSTKTSLMTVPVTRANDNGLKGSQQTAFTYIQTPLNRVDGVQAIGTPNLNARASFRVPPGDHTGYSSGSNGNSGTSRSSSCRRPILGSSDSDNGYDNDNFRPPTGFMSPVMSGDKGAPCPFRSPRISGQSRVAYASLRMQGARMTAGDNEMARSSMMVMANMPSPPHSDDFANCDSSEYWDNAGGGVNEAQETEQPLLQPSPARLTTSGRIIAVASQLQQEADAALLYSPPSLSKPLLFNGAMQNAAIL